MLLVKQVVAGKPGRVETPKRKALRAAVSATIENIRFISSSCSNSNSIAIAETRPNCRHSDALPSGLAPTHPVQDSSQGVEGRKAKDNYLKNKLLLLPSTLFFPLFHPITCTILHIVYLMLPWCSRLKELLSYYGELT